MVCIPLSSGISRSTKIISGCLFTGNPLSCSIQSCPLMAINTRLRSSNEFTFCSNVLRLITLSSANAINVDIIELFVKKINLFLQNNTKYVVVVQKLVIQWCPTAHFFLRKDINPIPKLLTSYFLFHYRYLNN